MPVEPLTEDIVITSKTEGVSFKKFMQPEKVMHVIYADKLTGVSTLDIPLKEYSDEEARKRVLAAVALRQGEEPPKEEEE